MNKLLLKVFIYILNFIAIFFILMAIVVVEPALDIIFNARHLSYLNGFEYYIHVVFFNSRTWLNIIVSSFMLTVVVFLFNRNE